LPSGWEALADGGGRVVFRNNTFGRIQTQDPRTSDNNNKPLPPRWEQRLTVGGRVYFENHEMKITTFQDPRGEEASET